MGVKAVESIEDLLAQVKAEYQKQKPDQQPEQSKQSEQQPLFQEEELQAPPTPYSTYSSQSSQHTVLTSADESLLAEVKAEFEDRDQAEQQKKKQQQREEQQKKEQQQREEQLRLQQREKRKREALTQEAQEWLKNLNPRSEEGLWFEEFSYSYSSKLEAAIDYLQALRETRL